MQLKTVRVALYGAIVLVLAAIGGLYAASHYFGQNDQLGLLTKPSNMIGGAFTLTDQTGKTVTDKDLVGKPALMFFGYTFCPDVCPTTLSEAGEWLKALGPDADKLQIYFVTVDPTRDTPQQLKDYLSSFDPRIRGLTGTADQTAVILKDYRVYARKVEQGNGADYLMDHTAAVYLMDAKGQFVGVINYGEDQGKAIAKLKDLVQRG